MRHPWLTWWLVVALAATGFGAWAATSWPGEVPVESGAAADGSGGRIAITSMSWNTTADVWGFAGLSRVEAPPGTVLVTVEAEIELTQSEFCNAQLASTVGGSFDAHDSSAQCREGSHRFIYVVPWDYVGAIAGWDVRFFDDDPLLFRLRPGG